MPRIDDPVINPFKLAAAIVERSVANTWDEAKLEWSLDEVYLSDDPGTCLCGHSPILEHCIIRNRQNGNTALVGNVCVQKFLGLNSDKTFQAIRRISDDPNRAMNAELIEYAHEKEWLNDWEMKFYFDTMRKKKLSAKQRAKRREINRFVLKCLEPA